MGWFTETLLGLWHDYIFNNLYLEGQGTVLSNPGTEEAPRARHTSEGDVMPTLQMKRQKVPGNQGWLAP